MSGESILVVIDDESARKRIKDHLIKGGFEVSIEPGGQPSPGSDYRAIVLSKPEHESAAERLVYFRKHLPAVPVIMIYGSKSQESSTLSPCFEDAFAYLPSNPDKDALMQTVHNAVDHYQRLKSWALGLNTSEEMQAGVATRTDGLIVTDSNNRLSLLNASAIEILKLRQTAWRGKSISEVIDLPELVEAIRIPNQPGFTRVLLEPSPGQHYSAQIFPLEGGGKVATLHYVTKFNDLERLKDDMMHAISHDLRSPLTAVLGYVELIAKVGPVNTEQERFIHRVQVSVNTITKLIDDLLHLGKIESDTNSPMDSVDIRQVVEMAVSVLQKSIDKKQQSVRVEIAPALPPVRGRLSRLHLLLCNLIDNAHRFSAEGKEIIVSGFLSGGEVHIRVEDQGIGIPVIEIPFIFEKQFRGSNIPVDLPGTGLGLSFAQAIVENHSGRIWCESKENVGTAFTIALPVAASKI